MKKYWMLIYIFCLALLWQSCKRIGGDFDPTTEPGKQSDSLSDQTQVEGTQRTDWRILPSELDDEGKIEVFLANASPYIKEARQSGNPSDATLPMLTLLSVWNPIGKTLADLEQRIGPPTSVDAKCAVYVMGLPSDVESFMFTFDIMNGRIVEFYPRPDFQNYPNRNSGRASER